MKKRSGIILLFVILFASLFLSINASADVVSVNSGGDTNLVIDSSGSVEDFFFGVPVAAEESGSEEAPSGGDTGTGGGGAAQESFTIDKTLIHQIIRPGESLREEIKITNNLDSSIDFEINSSLSEFMVISEESFSLLAKETKIIFIDFFAKTTELPDAYTGKVTIVGDGKQKVVNVILEIKERKPLFDVLVDILNNEVAVRSNVRARFKILNLGDLNNIDVVLYYAIKDYDGNIIAFKEESIAINKELNVVRNLNVPSDTPLGSYVVYLRAYYNNITASSTETFSVVEKPVISLQTILIASGSAFVIIVFVLFIVLFSKFKQHVKKREKTVKVKKVYAKLGPKPKPVRKRKGIGFFEKRRREWEKMRAEKELILQKNIAERRNVLSVTKRKRTFEFKSKLKRQLKRQREREYARKVLEERRRERKEKRTRSRATRSKSKEHVKEKMQKAKAQRQMERDYIVRMRLQNKIERNEKRRLAWRRFFKKLKVRKGTGKRNSGFYHRVVKKTEDGYSIQS